MSGLSVRHTDWLNENAYRRYPLVDGASADVPRGLIVDMVLPVPIDLVSPDQLFLKSVIGFGQGVVISFGLTTNPSAAVASATVFLADHELNRSYMLVGAGPIAGAVGRINIGTVQAVQESAATSRDFTDEPQSARVVPSVVRPAIRGISSFNVLGAAGAVAVSGAITLVPGANIELVADEATGRITINSNLTIQEADQQDNCGCVEAEDPERPCIRSINGILPDSSGNVNIVGSNNLAISASGNGLAIDDSSTVPCCECDQVDVLYQALQAVENESSQLLAIAEQLRGRIDTLGAVVGASALNPPVVSE